MAGAWGGRCDRRSGETCAPTETLTEFCGKRNYNFCVDEGKKKAVGGLFGEIGTINVGKI